MQMCAACGDELALVPVQESGVKAKLCIGCTGEYKNGRPDKDQPLPGHLRRFVRGDEVGGDGA